MKRVIGLVLSVILVICLASCSSEQTSITQLTTQPTTEKTTAEQTTEKRLKGVITGDWEIVDSSLGEEYIGLNINIYTDNRAFFEFYDDKESRSSVYQESTYEIIDDSHIRIVNIYNTMKSRPIVFVISELPTGIKIENNSEWFILNKK